MSKYYVLQLQNGKYYIGTSSNIETRVRQHKIGDGSEWTKIFKPVKVLETGDILDSHTENNITKNYMQKYGIENVRGGSYSQVTLADATFEVLQKEFRGNTNTCFKCGSSEHWARNCHIEEDEEEEIYVTNCCGKEFKVLSRALMHERRCTPIQEKAKNCCYRCGRYGHYVDDCYASYHLKGYEIEDEDEYYDSE